MGIQIKNNRGTIERYKAPISYKILYINVWCRLKRPLHPLSR
jgi:hypothetical protein